MTYKDLAHDLHRAENVHDRLEALNAISNYYANARKSLEDIAQDLPVTKRCRVHFNWIDNKWPDKSWGWNTCFAEAGQTPREAVEYMLYTSGADVNKQWGKDRESVEYKNVRVIDYVTYDNIVKATYMD